MKRVCPYCDGTGDAPLEPKAGAGNSRQCRNCGGTGRVESSRVKLPLLEALFKELNP